MYQRDIARRACFEIDHLKKVEASAASRVRLESPAANGIAASRPDDLKAGGTKAKLKALARVSGRNAKRTFHQ